MGEHARELKLKLMKFNKVNSVHLFLDRPGADTVALAGFKLFGGSVQGTDMANLRKSPEEGAAGVH